MSYRHCMLTTKGGAKATCIQAIETEVGVVTSGNLKLILTELS